MREREMAEVGDLMAEVLAAPEDAAVLGDVRERVRDLCRRFPLYDALS
jgi:glycine/serine hydroxymethyltransferase